jgi:hypothetical protein
MYLAVRFWKDSISQPGSAPDYWPKYVKELGNSRELPGPEWVLMTRSDLAAYKAARQDTYNAWIAANTAQATWADPDAPQE